MSTMDMLDWRSERDVSRRQHVFTIRVQIRVNNEDIDTESGALAALFSQAGTGSRSMREVMQILCDRVVHEDHLDMIQKLPKLKNKSKRALDVG